MKTDEKIMKKIINKTYKLLVDQDFVDAYYIILDIFYEDKINASIKSALEKMISLRAISPYAKDCYEIIYKNNNYLKPKITLGNKEEFASVIIKRFRSDKEEFSKELDRNKKYYVIELNFDEIMYLSTLSAVIGGNPKNTSRKLFSDDGCVVTKVLFRCAYPFSGSAEASVYFTKDMLKYIEQNENNS